MTENINKIRRNINTVLRYIQRKRVIFMHIKYTYSDIYRHAYKYHHNNGC